jgi:HlyD family secretion protein
VYGLGTVEARIVSRIGFEVGAALTDLAVDSGEAVAEGQVLARLHTAEQEARVARAEAAAAAAAATLGKAEANVVRARGLSEGRMARITG